MSDQFDIPQGSSEGAGRLWRSLADWERDPQLLERVRQEFAPGAEWWLDQPSRRAFLKRMSASFALAGLTGCLRQPKEEIVPYVQTPETIVPGEPLFFATAMPQPGGAIGILVESHEGRPTKIEGNSLHPSSLGATDTYAQASILGLYDPHRSRVVRQGDLLSSWVDFQPVLQAQLEQLRAEGGAGLHLLTESILSPTLQQQLQDVLKEFPGAKWYQYEPSLPRELLAGTELAFGRRLTPSYHLESADIIFSLDADFLGEGAARTRLAREYSSRRKVTPGASSSMNRMYVAESSATVTGTSADHWLCLNPSQLFGLMVELARQCGVEAGPVGENVRPPESATEWIAALADDLKAARGRSVVIVGGSQPAALQALGHAINAQLGNTGSTVTYLEPLDAVPGATPGTIADLSGALDAGQVRALLVIGGDPVYTAPREFELGSKIRKVPFSVHYGLYVDESAAACHWHLPATHDLEQWSDTQGEDGTATLMQPLIAPLYDGRSAHELFSLLLGELGLTGKDIVEGFWRGKLSGDAGFQWRKSLQDGVIEGTAKKPVSVTAGGNLADALPEAAPKLSAEAGNFTLLFRNDVNLLDGRYSTNNWLQELPRPITKLTWGNAAWISRKSAEDLGLKNGSHVEVRRGDASIEIPVWIQPGQPDGVLTLSAGHARRVGDSEVVGVDIAPLRTWDRWWSASGSVQATGARTVLATTQDHHYMEGRDLVRVGTLAQLEKDPEHPEFMHVGHSHMPPKNAQGNYPTLYPERAQEGPQWGMTIDLTSCIGCNACVVACQSENNIPVVGADQIRRGREMYWLRIDSYFAGEPDAPEVYNQPVACMHCEHAPCEPVCPVGATTHSDSGLNEMTYNRCIGTRYCSNNCPYKVRRFNFLDFNTEVKDFPVLQLMENPNVSVRSRGVMEKCTYCVQRINSVRIRSKMDGREIADGEIVTACQSACPVQGITFGNVADPNSEVAKAKKSPLNYGLLEELNTRPRTSYLAAVKNPNPRLVKAPASHEGDGHGHGHAASAPSSRQDLSAVGLPIAGGGTACSSHGGCGCGSRLTTVNLATAAKEHG